MAEHTITKVTGISCDKPSCPRRVNFAEHVNATSLNREHYAVPELIALGWSLWVGGRGRRTYCPEHGPTVQMRRVW